MGGLKSRINEGGHSYNFSRRTNAKDYQTFFGEINLFGFKLKMVKRCHVRPRLKITESETHGSRDKRLFL